MFQQKNNPIIPQQNQNQIVQLQSKCMGKNPQENFYTLKKQQMAFFETFKNNCDINNQQDELFFQLSGCIINLIEFIYERTQDAQLQTTILNFKSSCSQKIILDRTHTILLQKLIHLFEGQFQKENKEKIKLSKQTRRKMLEDNKENKKIKFENIHQIYKSFSETDNTKEFFDRVLQKIIDSQFLGDQEKLVHQSLEQIHDKITKDNFFQDPVVLPYRIYYSRDPHIINARQKFREQQKLSNIEVKNQKLDDKLGFQKFFQQQPLVTEIFPHERVLTIHQFSISKTYQVVSRGVLHSLRKPQIFKQIKSTYFLSIVQGFFSERIKNILQFQMLLSQKVNSFERNMYSELIISDVKFGFNSSENDEIINDIEMNLNEEQVSGPIYAFINLREFFLSDFPQNVWLQVNNAKGGIQSSIIQKGSIFKIGEEEFKIDWN